MRTEINLGVWYSITSVLSYGGVIKNMPKYNAGGLSTHCFNTLVQLRPGPGGGRPRLVHYWSRRIVVASMKRKMDMLLKRQCAMSPGFSRVESLSKRIAPCDMLMPGGTRGYLSNRGRRRNVASFPRSVCVSVSGGGVGSG